MKLSSETFTPLFPRRYLICAHYSLQNLYWHKSWQEPVSKSNFDIRKGKVEIEWFRG